jgi:hypothetical protein
MAQLILDDVDPDLVHRLEQRAQRRGTTIQLEVVTLLQENLRDESAAPPESSGGEEQRSPTSEEPAPDPRFTREFGFLVFTGPISPDAIPDHRALREERIDSLLKECGEGRG